jgi:2-dehydro-3-deoxy-D-arabinonate dehydratase
MAESERAGGDVFYDLVYDAERPEIFFKATAHRVVGDGGAVRIRADSTWDVPEPEFTLAVSPAGRIIGYTIGNDMSSRSIEGANPLYLPQAKVYDGCAAIGPRLVLGELPPADTAIHLSISRDGTEVFTGRTALDQIKRRFDELVDYLFRDNSYPAGVLVMTGTGIVPGDDFTLEPGDVVAITIDPVGTLTNHVVRS